jgi:hypothetical protein
MVTIVLFLWPGGELKLSLLQSCDPDHSIGVSFCLRSLSNEYTIQNGISFTCPQGQHGIKKILIRFLRWLRDIACLPCSAVPSEVQKSKTYYYYWLQATSTQTGHGEFTWTWHKQMYIVVFIRWVLSPGTKLSPWPALLIFTMHQNSGMYDAFRVNLKVWSKGWKFL